VRAGKDFHLKHLTVTSSNPDFKTKVEQAGTGEFKINVQPRETSGIAAATLTIHTGEFGQSILRHCQRHQCAGYPIGSEVFAGAPGAYSCGARVSPGIGQAIYFRYKVSWQLPVPASEMVTVVQARRVGRKMQFGLMHGQTKNLRGTMSRGLYP
jgi:hypothetical protein